MPPDERSHSISTSPKIEGEPLRGSVTIGIWGRDGGDLFQARFFGIGLTPRLEFARYPPSAAVIDTDFYRKTVVGVFRDPVRCHAPNMARPALLREAAICVRFAKLTHYLAVH